MSRELGSAYPRRWPWAVAAADLAGFAVVAVAFSLDPSFGVVAGSAVVSTVLVGSLLMVRAPTNVVGALLLAAGTLLALSVGFGTYGEWSLAGTDPLPVTVGLAAVLNDALFVPPMIILLIGVPLYFPDGRLLSRRWRPVVWLTVVATVASSIVKVLSPTLAATDRIENPLGVQGLDAVLGPLDSLAALMAPIGLAAAIAAVAIRFRRGHGIEREQLKWFLSFVAICAIGFIVGILPVGSQIQDAAFLIAFAGLIALPISIGIAILRYRLYEIDRLVSRTIAYSIVTGGLISIYLIVNLTLTTAFSSLTRVDSVAVAASTLVVAALFTPARRRIQRFVDRRFDRARYDADRTSVAFAARLRDELDLPAVTDDLDSTVRLAVAPVTVEVWLRSVDR